jgi:hypothetical protein
VYLNKIRWGREGVRGKGTWLKPRGGGGRQVFDENRCTGAALCEGLGLVFG